MIDAIAVVGPTGSGKTDLSIKLAEKLKTEIISVDSMQFYKGMEIGTSAPPLEIRKTVPHHFVAFVPPDFEMSAGYFQNIARREIERIKEKGKMPIIVGGSGLYLSAVIDGLFKGPGRCEEIRDKIKEEIRRYGIEEIFNRLKGIDPLYAERLTSPRDVVRLVRALEVFELTGKSYSQWHKEHQSTAKPLNVFIVGINWERETLYERINLRVHEMIKKGWIEELLLLLERGYEKDIYRLKALGYRELLKFIRGDHNLHTAIENIKLHHRHYAKRQMIWFRADKRVKWFYVKSENEFEKISEEVLIELDNLASDALNKNEKCFLFRHLQ
ncbi:MAG: tRNA (adenosine(37)-N6)-dimethylallyltransferase MiaA [Candidatus Hydrogenedentes bacterium]|nr:tRNA (adenosine(37)-N6)-dimethylallyltransferase MiaA [Candidatus Hydrogenedentota bacterium]